MIDIVMLLLGMLAGVFLMGVINGNAYERGCDDTWEWIRQYVEEELEKELEEADSDDQ